jgi:hypothetical protein
MSDPTTTIKPLLPYEGVDFDEYRRRILRNAKRAEDRFGELTLRRNLSDAEINENRIAHYGSYYAYSVVTLLGYIREHFGEDEAFQAACVIDEMGADGDVLYADDILPGATDD